MTTLRASVPNIRLATSAPLGALAPQPPPADAPPPCLGVGDARPLLRHAPPQPLFPPPLPPRRLVDARGGGGADLPPDPPAGAPRRGAPRRSSRQIIPV